MKRSDFGGRLVAAGVAVCLAACFWLADVTPLRATSEAGGRQAEAQAGTDPGPGFIEKDRGGGAAVAKPRRFPWLVAGIGAFVVGLAAYFLVVKKKDQKRTLAVNMDPGVEGEPALTAQYKKGAAVAYHYSARPGFGYLQVKLDGTSVPADGKVIMDRDHSLAVSTVRAYTLTVALGPGVSGAPAASGLFPPGESVAYHYQALAGYGGLTVTLDGAAVPASGQVLMDRDHELAASATDLLHRRVVVAEEFTGTWCQFCPGAAMGLERLRSENPSTLAVIAYHREDSFTPVDGSYDVRSRYYGVMGIPHVYFDGVEDYTGGSAEESMYPEYKPRFDRRAAIPPAVQFTPLALSGNRVEVRLDTVGNRGVSGTLHCVVVEERIAYPWKNQSTVQFACRAMLPSPLGEAVQLAPGASLSVSRSFTLDGGWNRANCRIVFFLQESGKEIGQGIELRIP